MIATRVQASERASKRADGSFGTRAIAAAAAAVAAIANDDRLPHVARFAVAFAASRVQRLVSGDDAITRSSSPI